MKEYLNVFSQKSKSCPPRPIRLRAGGRDRPRAAGVPEGENPVVSFFASRDASNAKCNCSSHSLFLSRSKEVRNNGLIVPLNFSTKSMTLRVICCSTSLFNTKQLAHRFYYMRLSVASLIRQQKLSALCVAQKSLPVTI